MGKNIRFVIMNNILPSKLSFYQVYDLKGSTYKRYASRKELRKKKPTLKDLDFNSLHADGLHMPPDVYEKLISTLERDVLVLESFKIMDYSLLVGLHNTAVDSVQGSRGPLGQPGPTGGEPALDLPWTRRSADAEGDQEKMTSVEFHCSLPVGDFLSGIYDRYVRFLLPSGMCVVCVWIDFPLCCLSSSS